ncbi:MAG: 8-amino-7-oxononanoate synthase [Chitinispirillaceae bacterium]|nr:8-amino-7-oxononanoate synthase [Chitinispirillaceae bacterium]
MKSSPFHNRIADQLDERRAKGLFRSIPPFAASPSNRIDCSTNSYLGLHANEEVGREASRLTGERLSGNCASRLIADHSDLYRQLESEIAQWEGTETALVFTSGYTANLGVIQALCTRSTEVFADRLNHASIFDGIRLSGATLIRYGHCDMAELKKCLQQSTAPEKLIITDTVFSMDGDRAPLCDIADLGRSFGALVMVDEAHATGMFGENGSGLVEATGTAKAIDIRMGTLSKAIAGLGGYVATSVRFRDYFVNFCRSLVYSTGLPHAVLAHNLAAIRYLREHPRLGAAVVKSAALLREAFERIGFSTGPATTQIIPCFVGDERETVALSTWLRAHGVIAPAIRPPAVPKSTSRLRFSWSALCGDEARTTISVHLQQWKSEHV